MKNISFLLFCFLPFFSLAQINHEISIGGGGGLSTLNYKLPAGKPKPGFGGEAGIGYTCVFIKMIGIHVGADIAFYNANATLNGVTVITKNLTDNEGENFNMHTTLSKYKEIQNAMYLNIPIMAHFQIGKNHKFYAMAGVKIGIPLNCKYKQSGATLSNEGYYPEYDNWLKEPEFAGFGTFPIKNANGKIKYNVSAAIALEAGMKWNITKLFAIYTGVYFDYGLNSIVKKNDQKFIGYNKTTPANFTVNSGLAGHSNKINLMAVGLKVRLALLPCGKNDTLKPNSKKATLVAKKEKGGRKKQKVENDTLKPNSQKATLIAKKEKGGRKKQKVASSYNYEYNTETVPVEAHEGVSVPVEIELTSATEFVLGRPARTGFPATATGISWVSNIDAQTAKFTTAPNTLVILPEKAAYDIIQTQENLKEAFDTGKKTGEFTVKSGIGFKPLYLIVQLDDTLHLIEMTNLIIKAGESKALFLEKH